MPAQRRSGRARRAIAIVLEEAKVEVLDFLLERERVHHREDERTDDAVRLSEALEGVHHLLATLEVQPHVLLIEQSVVVVVEARHHDVPAHAGAQPGESEGSSGGRVFRLVGYE